jgi:hypothetical protein
MGDKVQRYVVAFVRIVTVIAFAVAIPLGNWQTAALSALTFAATFLPAFIERESEVHIPVEFAIALVVFVYMTLFLGEAQDFHERFAWWDLVVHSGSALVFGSVGFLILHTLVLGKKFTASAGTIALFTFCFAMAIGGVWEIFEFTVDHLFGLTMQDNSLVDTMWDLIVDALGALVAAGFAFAYVKRSPFSPLEGTLARFDKDNPTVSTAAEGHAGNR